MNRRVDVILVRFSSELQRTDSNKDQERRCREALDRWGIPHNHFRVIADEAVSGVKDDRPGLEAVNALIRERCLGTVIVTEQSRLSRNNNAPGMIKDIVYQGGRFLSVNEGIDTDKQGWEMLVGISGIHHAHSNVDTAARVRGGQSGRVLDAQNGSAGDYPYGYTSEFVDPQGALGYCGRGPKPKKKVVVEPAAADVVVQVFRRFVEDGESISAIVRWWEARKESFPRITKTQVHHQHVRRMLANAKYVGRWSYGQTTTIRNQHGKKKQVPARADQQVVRVDRPHLQIVPQDLWEAAQRRVAELKDVYGMKKDGAKRGPREHYKLHYEKSLLGGMVRCAQCGSRLRAGGRSDDRRLGCPKHRAGQCAMAAGVPYERAQTAVLNVIEAILMQYPDWLKLTIGHARAAAAELSRGAPDLVASLRAKLTQVDRQINHIVAAISQGLNSDALGAELAALERQKGELSKQVVERQEMAAAPQELPGDPWILEQLKGLAGMLKGDMARIAPVLRALLGEVVAEEVKPVGKKRGYSRIRFSLDGWAALRHVLGRELPDAVLEALKPVGLPLGRSGEFVIDLGASTRMDRWAPEILQWRNEGVTWKEIGRRTGSRPGNAYTACKRYKEGIEAAS